MTVSAAGASVADGPPRVGACAASPRRGARVRGRVGCGYERGDGNGRGRRPVRALVGMWSGYDQPQPDEAGGDSNRDAACDPPAAAWITARGAFHGVELVVGEDPAQVRGARHRSSQQPRCRCARDRPGTPPASRTRRSAARSAQARRPSGISRRAMSASSRRESMRWPPPVGASGSAPGRGRSGRSRNGVGPGRPRSRRRPRAPARTRPRRPVRRAARTPARAGPRRPGRDGASPATAPRERPGSGGAPGTSGRDGGRSRARRTPRRTRSRASGRPPRRGRRRPRPREEDEPYLARPAGMGVEGVDRPARVAGERGRADEVAVGDDV